MTRIIVMTVLIVTAASSAIVAQGAAILDTNSEGAGTVTYTGWDNADNNWWYGYWHSKSTWTGQDGIYEMNVKAQSLGIDHQILGCAWYNVDTDTKTLDGWRQKELDLCSGTASVNWAVDLSVQITGNLNADNGFIAPLGDASVYAWSKMFLTGLAEKTIETKGDPYHIEEGIDSTVGVSDPINVSLPINVSNDTADINGDGADSSSGTKADATDGCHIRVRGRVVGRAKVWDGAWNASGTIKTSLETFSLTINN